MNAALIQCILYTDKDMPSSWICQCLVLYGYISSILVSPVHVGKWGDYMRPKSTGITYSFRPVSNLSSVNTLVIMFIPQTAPRHASSGGLQGTHGKLCEEGCVCLSSQHVRIYNV